MVAGPQLFHVWNLCGTFSSLWAAGIGSGVGDGVAVGAAVTEGMGDGVMVGSLSSSASSVTVVGTSVGAFVGTLVGVGNSNAAAFSGAATVGNNGDNCSGTAIARSGSGKREA